MELSEKTVAEIKERLLAIQEMLADIDEALSAEQENLVEENPVETVVEKKPEVVEEDEEDEEDTEKTVEEVIAEQGLADMSEDELKEILDAYEIKYTGKNKKQSLMEKVAQGILDGVIEVEDDNEDVEEVQDPLSDTDVETTPREEAEQKILAEINEQLESKVLTKKKATEWLKNHFGSGDCGQCPKGCTDDPIECYKTIKVSFVDDEGNINAMEDPYMRDGSIFCCGVECQPFEDGKVVCEVCGQVYEYEEEN